MSSPFVSFLLTNCSKQLPTAAHSPPVRQECSPLPATAPTLAECLSSCAGGQSWGQPSVLLLLMGHTAASPWGLILLCMELCPTRAAGESYQALVVIEF